MSREPSTVALVVFDWAGTTIDFGSRGPVAVFQQVFDAAGLPVSEEEVRVPMGMEKRAHIRAVLSLPAVATRWRAARGAAWSEEDVDAMYARFVPIQAEVVARFTTLIDGVAPVVEALRARGARIGATTGYPASVMDIVKPLAAAQGYAPDLSLASDEIGPSRPSPEGVLMVMRALGAASPGRTVVVDDSVVGIQAGRAAGAWAVGVAASGNLVGLAADALAALPDHDRAALLTAAASQLRDAGAHFVVPTVADLQPIVETIERALAAGSAP